MTTLTDVAAFQAVAGAVMVARDSVATVTVQVITHDGDHRDRLATVLGEALGADVEAVGRSRYIEHGGVLVELTSEEE